MPVHTLSSRPPLADHSRAGWEGVRLARHAFCMRGSRYTYCLLREREKLSVRIQGEGSERFLVTSCSSRSPGASQHSNSLSMAPPSTGTAAVEGAAAVNISMATPPSGHGGQSPLPALTPELLERMVPHVLNLRVIKLLDEAGLIRREEELAWAHRNCYQQIYAEIRAFTAAPISRKRCR